MNVEEARISLTEALTSLEIMNIHGAFDTPEGRNILITHLNLYVSRALEILII